MQEEGPPSVTLKGKNKYLYYIGTKDAIKEEVRWRYGLQLMEQTMAKTNNQSKEKNKVKPKKNKAKSQSKSDIPKPTKLEQKLQFKEYMKQLKETWSSLSGEGTYEQLGVTIPDGLKKYTIQDQKVIMQKPK